MNKFILILLIVLLSISVTGYQIDDIICKGDIKVQINEVKGDTNNVFKNCVEQINMSYNWLCNCSMLPEVININNESATVSARFQYYIDDVTNDTILNEQRKRVETKTITLEKPTTNVDEGFDVNSIDFVLVMIIFIVLLGITISIIIFYFIFIREKKQKKKETYEDEVNRMLKEL